MEAAELVVLRLEDGARLREVHRLRRADLRRRRLQPRRQLLDGPVELGVLQEMAGRVIMLHWTGGRQKDETGSQKRKIKKAAYVKISEKIGYFTVFFLCDTFLSILAHLSIHSINRRLGRHTIPKRDSIRSGHRE